MRRPSRETSASSAAVSLPDSRWARDAKDALALGNITGAMVFQSTLPVAFGLTFTDWDLDRYSIVAGMLALGGGGLAILELQLRKRFVGRAVATWACLY